MTVITMSIIQPVDRTIKAYHNRQYNRPIGYIPDQLQDRCMKEI